MRLTTSTTTTTTTTTTTSPTKAADSCCRRMGATSDEADEDKKERRKKRKTTVVMMQRENPIPDCVDREEREGDFVVLDEGEEEGEDDEEAFIGARGELQLPENYETELVVNPKTWDDRGGFSKEEQGAHFSEKEEEEEEEEKEKEEEKKTFTGGSFIGAKSGVACTEAVQRVIAELTEKTPAGTAERSRIEKQKTKQIVPNLERWKRTSAKEITELEEMSEETLKRMEMERDLENVWFHFDYDMFYAQAAIVENPVLRDMPFVVGAPVCTTASYVARKFGIRSGMPTHTAMKLYKHGVNNQARKTAKEAYHKGLRERFPIDEERKSWETMRREELGGKRYDKAFEFKELMVTGCDFERYGEIAKLGQEVYRKYDQYFLAPSSDEVYLNMTEHFKFDQREMTTEEKHAEMEETMKKIRKEVFEKTKLTVSGGGGPSMRLAKICSDVNKPNGQKILKFTSEDILEFLSTLSIRKIGGIGASMERYLNAFDVKTCGDILKHKAKLAKVCHATAYTFLFSVAMGIGMENVPLAIQEGAPGRRGVSMSRSWYPAIRKYDSLFKILKFLAQDVSKEVKRLKFIPRQVTITVKFQHNFQQVTRQRDLAHASQNYKDWMITIKDLFDKLYHEFNGNTKPFDVRKLGVRVSKFKGEELENIMEDQRMDQFVPKAEKADELPLMSSGIYHDLQFETYECSVCGGTFKKTEQRDHELAHEYDRTYRREGAHISSSSTSLKKTFATSAPLQGKFGKTKNRILVHKHTSKLKPVVQKVNESSKKIKQVAAIDKQHWKNKYDRSQTRLKK